MKIGPSMIGEPPSRIFSQKSYENLTENSEILDQDLSKIPRKIELSTL
jgi:hypothetical protein